MYDIKKVGKCASPPFLMPVILSVTISVESLCRIVGDLFLCRPT